MQGAKSNLTAPPQNSGQRSSQALPHPIDRNLVSLPAPQDLYVIPLPQTLQVTPTPTHLAHWGLTSLSVTAGDWVRLEVTGQQPVQLQQPLILSGDVIFTGAVKGRELGATGGAPTLQCAAAANSTAISIRYVDRRQEVVLAVCRAPGVHSCDAELHAVVNIFWRS
jgi:hypothetical protein